MDGRNAFKCQRGDWDTTGTGGVGYLPEGKTEWIYNLTYQCGSVTTPYCLQVDDIRVRWKNDKWEVYDWSAICEANDASFVCSELCE